jgi:hypothetical protein
MTSVRIVTLLALIGSIGCSAKPPEPTTASQQSGDSSGMTVSGVVKRVQVSGGCWQLAGNDSTNYELRADQAPAELLVDQKQVTVTLKPRPDLMSTCMVGQIVDVVR